MKALAAVVLALSLPLVAACGSSDQALSDDQISALSANNKLQNDGWAPLKAGIKACAKASSSFALYESCTGKLLDRYAAPMAAGVALLKKYSATVKGDCAAKLESAASAAQQQFVATREAGAALKDDATQQQFDSVLGTMDSFSEKSASTYNALAKACGSNG